jgi:hypothetical protein
VIEALDEHAVIALSCQIPVSGLLRTRYPERFHPGQARTLQRHFRDWRAQSGGSSSTFGVRMGS